jgi:protein-disulfide isomerase
MTRVLRAVFLAALVAAAFAVLLACGDDDDTADSSVSAANTATNLPTPVPPSEGIQGTVSSDAFRDMPVAEDLAEGFFLGDPAAPLQLVVYEDFQCPFCLAFTLRSEPTIVEKFVVTGKLRIEFRNLPILGQESAQAAFAAQCAADTDRFWAFHRELFLAQYDAGQLEREQINVGRFSTENLVAMAGTAGIVDTAGFETCLLDTATRDAVIASVKSARDIGITSTPSFLLNGQPLARYPGDPESWTQFLEQAMAD